MTGCVKHFRELKVYQRQREISREVFQLSKQFPAEEKSSLTDQIRRSSRSIGAQLAEAWGKRRYPKHFISKLTDADGEQLETQHWLIEARDCECHSEDDFHRLTNSCEELGRMLGSMIQKTNSFSGSPDRLQEDGIPCLPTGSDH